MAPVESQSRPALSVVVPVFNERENVTALLERVLSVLGSIGLTFEVLFVDDGSSDGTPDEIVRLSSRNPGIRLLRLARNFGHQAALFAGLEHARGQAIVTLDGDLQHPPEIIPQLVQHWRDGADVVQTIRRDTADAGLMKKATSSWFYRLLSAVSRIRVTPGAADFRLLSREAADAFLVCRERCRFNRGLVQWIGFPHVEVPYTAEPRHAGRTKYSLRSMMRLAGDAIFSFSTLPLRIAGLVGGLVSLAAAGYLMFVIWAKLFTSWVAPGWTSTQATVLILGGMQLVVLWILGEYVGRLYEEAKQRPIYVIRSNGTAARPAPAVGQSVSCETKSLPERPIATGSEAGDDSLHRGL
ncbi:MAG: glycosyltransferase family 2 protein [Planctomycetes bacterium]|nr:glycosyltransferase family 2 protein [Planctomycetota bacterium]